MRTMTLFRFNSTNQGLTYELSNLDKIQLECRANQNPVGIYLAYDVIEYDCLELMGDIEDHSVQAHRV